jgi:phosphoribosylformylglycinamidine synthase
MAFAGGLGMSLRLADVPRDLGDRAGAELDACLLFSESNTRFLCEVPPEVCQRFAQALDGVPHAVVGRVESDSRLRISGTETVGTLVIDAELADLKEAWQKPLRW